MTATSILRGTLLTMALALASPALAAGPASWVPARWQGGPIEVQWRAREGTLPESAAVRETLERWYDPATLDLLRDTPIDCLLVTWSAGGDAAAERAHQQAVAAYARAARARGIAVLGLVHGPAAPGAFLRPAIDAELDGLVLDGAFPQDVVTEVARALRSARPSAVVIATGAPRADSAVLALPDAVAPGLQELGPEVEATPSSEPWIDFNFWLSQWHRGAAGTRPMWLMQPLRDRAAPADYERAIADAAAGGARWVVAPDDALRHELRAGSERARETWRRVADALRFQQANAAWPAREPWAVAGFVRDAAADDGGVSEAGFKLTIRARVPTGIVERPGLAAPALSGFRALNALHLSRPTAAEREALSAFARDGGLVLVGPSWHDAPVTPGEDCDVLPNGRGRIAVCRDDLDAPEAARALVDLLGRDNLGVRLFRASSVLGHATRGASGDGDEVLVHLINYASHPAESVLVRVNGEFTTVHLHTPGRSPEALPLDRAAGRVEATVSSLPVYAILRFSKRGAER